VYEGIIFSYPICHDNWLVVCGDAVAQHNDGYFHKSFAKSMFCRKSQVVMSYVLVAANADLGKPAFF